MKRHIEKGKLLEKVNLAPFTSWLIGGDAERFYWPTSLDDLSNFLRATPPHEPLIWLGLGSNVLIADSGLSGTVLVTQGALMGMSQISPNRVRAEAGVSCAQVARFAARNNLVEGEFLAGIPGTVGGALAMNAGAFGGETWEKVVAVETINRQGEIALRDPKEFSIAYRSVKGLQDEWFVAGIFEFSPGDGKASLEKIKALLDKRAQTQPTGEPSCGSVFRNPPGNYAGHLIETCGLKGTKIGEAQVSPKHANFIINTGNATARDTAALIRLVQARVQAEHGVLLHPEVHFLGKVESE